MQIDTLICGKWVIPVEPDRRVLEDHAVAVSGGAILELLPTEIARARYEPAELHELGDHALLPGLVNAHTHAAMTLFRGLADDLPLMDWLNNHIWPAEQKWVSPRFVADGARLAAAEMILGGTTCFSDMYYFPDQVAEVLEEAGMRGVMGLILIEFPTPWASDADEYLDKGIRVHDRFKHSPLIRTAFAPHAPYTVSDASLRRLNTMAEELQIPIHMHVHEAESEIEQSLEQHGKRPLERLRELGMLSQRLIAVHMTQIEPEDLELVAHYKVNVAHCPESNLKLANGLCPVDDLIRAGINVALGTDSAASNNDLDMFGEMRTAALLGKGLAGDSSAVPAYTVLRMATINGARALDMDPLIGSLEKGKQADIIALELGGLETQPLYDPISQIVYAASRSQVSDVWVAGRQLMKNRELLTLDGEDIRARAREWAQKIRA
ncbi:MAG: TRZ/ATZ family hydrolase [Gammaproteobacteria bacterium]|nr:TRZ/ATZ family hydrolase [Gammaproteobacteria bacterium]